VGFERALERAFAPAFLLPIDTTSDAAADSVLPRLGCNA
jgi:hypothetical protein